MFVIQYYKVKQLLSLMLTFLSVSYIELTLITCLEASPAASPIAIQGAITLTGPSTCPSTLTARPGQIRFFMVFGIIIRYGRGVVNPFSTRALNPDFSSSANGWILGLFGSGKSHPYMLKPIQSSNALSFRRSSTVSL